MFGGNLILSRMFETVRLWDAAEVMKKWEDRMSARQKPIGASSYGAVDKMGRLVIGDFPKRLQVLDYLVVVQPMGEI